MTRTRIYLVSHRGDEPNMLIDARSQAEAIRARNAGQYRAQVASAREIADHFLGNANAKIFDASELLKGEDAA